MPIQTVLNEEGGVPVKIWTKDIEQEALTQLKHLSSLPFIHKHVAVMPDVHWGRGSTIGSVIPTIGAIVPAAVGVDIGCGMMACRLEIEGGRSLKQEDLPDSLKEIREAIESAIPHGRTNNGGFGDRGAWSTDTDFPEDVADAWEKLTINDSRWRALQEKVPKLFKGPLNSVNHLGTLGTGNHFIELCIDENGFVWVMLHSGSRGIGNRIGTYFINLAKEAMEDWHISLPNPDLAYIPEASELFPVYWWGLGWAQSFAKMNREIMMSKAIQAVSKALVLPLSAVDGAVNCHHNYVRMEHHFHKDVFVTRKGAVSAQEGELGIIPGSMGAMSFIVKGKGNKESFHSCSHGAGRKMSRGVAKKKFSIDDLKMQTEGVECRKDAGVIDEIPQAYKDIHEVMENQSDLVEIVATLEQVVCVKG